MKLFGKSHKIWVGVSDDRPIRALTAALAVTLVVLLAILGIVAFVDATTADQCELRHGFLVDPDNKIAITDPDTGMPLTDPDFDCLDFDARDFDARDFDVGVCCD